MPDRGEGDVDAELAAMRAGARRLGRRRAAIGLGAGLACAAAGAPIFFWGRHMDAIQAHSEVQFMAPMYAQFIGGAVLLAGCLLVVLGLVAFLMSAAAR